MTTFASLKQPNPVNPVNPLNPDSHDGVWGNTKNVRMDNRLWN